MAPSKAASKPVNPEILTPSPTIQVPTALETASRALELGYRPVAVNKQTKRALKKDWQLLTYTPSTLRQDFSGNRINVGLQWGNGLIDVDLETDTAVAVADMLLPPTGFMWGRAAKPRSHRVYRVDGNFRTKKFKDENKTLIVELRGEESQSVIPYSIHPEGEYYEWVDLPFGEPGEITYTRLMQLIKLLTTIVSEVECWRNM